ncbi:uncharacterized protein LOC105692081 isoform X1 [Athalia rosae]|uniref:uncharacterized protein LOC105692081 isoform X1 n=1 Tax=Athalia rosae TaxID=37344 RepID=UPI0020346723|nr:uncharacterized protein LOC105692081 isoform X1 [Athalia rosae]
MHRKTSKRSIPLTEKVKHRDPSTPMTIHKLEENGPENHSSMVSAQNSFTRIPDDKYSDRDVNIWPETEDHSWSWDQQSSGTSISWPEEMEEVASKKVMDQWEAVQRTLYDEDEQVVAESLRAECIQWRTQRPHLRILGRGLQRKEDETASQDIKDPTGPIRTKGTDNPLTISELIEEHSEPPNAPEDPLKVKVRDQTRKEVLNLLFDFVCSELAANKEDDLSLSRNLDTVLRITPAPTHSGRNPLRNHKTADEFVISTHRKMQLHKYGRRDSHDALELPGCLPEVHKNNYYSDKSGKDFLGRESIMPISARRQRDMKDMVADGILVKRDRLYTPQLPRNALGTVFSEKIIVSPVPFATTTRESFSTLKSTPLGSMRLSFESSLPQRSAKSVNLGVNAISARRAGLFHIPQVHSAWQAPVCPTVWPKNVKLAPIDLTRLPSSQRRSLVTSLTQPRRSRNSLSPIPRDIMPASPLTIQDPDMMSLEIHGRQIVKQKSRTNVSSAAWNSSPQNLKKGRKKIQNNNER